MEVEDGLYAGPRIWVRLREKGGKRHAMPCHHNLEEYLNLMAYLDGAGLRDDPKGPLFHTIERGTRQAHAYGAAPQQNAYAMIRPASCSGRDPNQARQPQLSRHRHHGLSQERRHAGNSRGNGQPCLDAHHAALRSPEAHRFLVLRAAVVGAL
jgi:hypothetical protein